MAAATYGSYKVVGTLGEGGMGVVYEASHSLIGKRAAIKLLRPQFSQDRDLVQRFFNEAKAATVVKHPGIVEVFDFGYDDTGAAFIVMEFLEGESLATKLRREGVLPQSLALTITRQVASAIAAAHVKGIVHRDLKPDNIFVVPHSETASGILCKVLDFGIAKLQSADGTGHAKTQTGTMMGTPLYMSPEQCRGISAIDGRSDIYSLGCILYQMVVGKPPFLGEGIGDIIGAHIHVAPELPSRVIPSVAMLDDLIGRMLAKKPEGRIATMDAVVTEIDRLLPRASVERPAVAPAPISKVVSAVAATMADSGPDITEREKAVAETQRRDPTPLLPATTTLSSVAGEAAPTPPRPSRRGLLIGGGAVAALAVGGAVFALRRPSSQQPLAIRVSLIALAKPKSAELLIGNKRIPATAITSVVDANGPASLAVVVQATTRFLGLRSEDRGGAWPAVVEALDMIGKSGWPGLRATLLTYGNRVRTVLPLGKLTNISGRAFGSDEDYENQIAADLVSGVSEAFDVLRRDGVGRKHLLVIGTGEAVNADVAKGELLNLKKQLSNAHVEVHAVQLLDESVTRVITTLARQTVITSSYDELAPRVNQVMSRLRDEYLIDFAVPPPPSRTDAELVIDGESHDNTVMIDPEKPRFELVI